MKNYTLIKLILILIYFKIQICSVFSFEKNNIAPISNLSQKYVESEINTNLLLNISEGTILPEIWNNQITFHLKLYEIAVNLMRLTAKYGIFFEFPENDLKYLSSIFDFSAIDFKKNPLMMRYALGFMAYNMINPYFFSKNNIPSSNLALSYDLNLILFTALNSSKINISDLDMKVKEVKDSYSNLFSSNLLESLFFKYHEEYIDLKIDSLFSFFINNQKIISKEQKNSFYEFAKTVFKVWRDDKQIPFHEIAGNKFFGKKIQTKIKILPQYKSLLPKNLFSDNFEEYFNSLIEVELSYDENAFFQTTSLFTQIFKEPISGMLIPGAKISKVKKIGKEFFIKRVDISRVKYPDEEIVIAKQFEKQIQITYPQIKSQEFIGIIFSNGNYYLISKAAKGIPFNNLWNDDMSFFQNNYLPIIIKQLKIYGVFDPEGQHLRERECYLNLYNGNFTITVLDFETSPYRFFNMSDFFKNYKKKNLINTIFRNYLFKNSFVNAFIIDNKA